MGDYIAGDKYEIHGQVAAVGSHATAEGNTLTQGGGPAGSPGTGNGSWSVVWALVPTVLLVLLGLFALRPWDSAPVADSIYRLHVTVLDPQGQPVEGGEVYSSVGGELQKVDGGWEIEIPAAKRPTDGRIEIRASERASFLEGSTEFEWVEGELQQAVTLRLEVPSDARVTGRVFDRDGNPVAGARVTSNRRPTSIEGGQHG